VNLFGRKGLSVAELVAGRQRASKAGGLGASQGLRH
jgi:hypothetical protein